MQKPVVVLTIIKLNLFVFFLWVVFGPFNPMMKDTFLVSWNSIMEGRLWTLITSVFSHSMLFHLLINMFVFFGFGAMLENHLGRSAFLKFYLMAGLAGSIAHSAVSALLLGQPELMALGASGAVSGVIMLFSFMFPHEKILLLGLIPAPAMLGAVLFVGLDVWGLVAQTQGSTLPIGHGAHLGGALFGFLYYFLYLKSHPPINNFNNRYQNH